MEVSTSTCPLGGHQTPRKTPKSPSWVAPPNAVGIGFQSVRFQHPTRGQAYGNSHYTIRNSCYVCPGRHGSLPTVPPTGSKDLCHRHSASVRNQEASFRLWLCFEESASVRRSGYFRSSNTDRRGMGSYRSRDIPDREWQERALTSLTAVQTSWLRRHNRHGAPLPRGRT